MRLLSLLVVVCLCGGCAPRPDDIVLRYIQLAVALGEHDPDALDYYDGPDDWVADARSHPPSLPDIERGALDLASNPKTSGFLVLQVRALAARAQLLQGRKSSFNDEAHALFNLELHGFRRPSGLEKVRRQIDTLLPGVSYADFDARFIIPAERIRAVMDRAMQACRERTVQHIKLPKEEAVSLEYVHNRPWSAYSSYKGRFHSVILINTDYALTVDRALQLACHEGYPGHHAYNTLVDAQLVQRKHRFELMVQPTFSPQSLSSEALATNAVYVAFSDEDRLQFERDVLFPLARLGSENIELYLRINHLVDRLARAEPEIARDYLDGTLEWSRAASALEEQALMQRTEATLKYLNQYRSYMLTYTVGKELVKDCVTGASESGQWKLFERMILSEISIQQCAGANIETRN